MSTEKRLALQGEFTAQIRLFIAGAILFNQQVAERHRLQLTDMQCINVLDLLGPTTPGKLAERTGLSTGGVTVMLDRLEKAGYVKREPNPTDRRSLLVRVNPKKFEKINASYNVVNERMAELYASTPESELQTVLEFFKQMNAFR
jgi:DNA-binding MarR family transcriptional regulator